MSRSLQQYVAWLRALPAWMLLIPMLACQETHELEEVTALSNSETSVHAVRGAKPTVPSSDAVRAVRVRRPPPQEEFRCEKRVSRLEKGGTGTPESIGLRPPTEEKTLEISKVGVVVTFSRQEFLDAAKCMKLKEAVRYIEEETAGPGESVLLDKYQLSYVAAALLDEGRADVRLRDESQSRKDILRDAWSAKGCNGRCRSFGREYRLSEEEPWPFFRVTDLTRNDGK